MIKLVASDLDGTLLQNITKTIHHYQDCELTASCIDHMYIEAHNPAFQHHMCNVVKNDITLRSAMSLPLSSLKLAGTSFAMANAVPGIADYCTGITDSVEKELKKLL